jgi:hypothetical protein
VAFPTWVGVADVNDYPTSAAVFRKIGLFALTGFAVVTLGGPIFAILSVLLSFALVLLCFALIGFLVWVPLRLLLSGREAAVTSIRELGVGVGRTLHQTGRAAARVMAFPVRLVSWVAAGAGFLIRGTWRLTWATARVLSQVAVFAATGALVGLGMTMVGGHGGPDTAPAVALNAVVGSAIGALAGLVMIIRERRALRVRRVKIAT